MTGYSKSEQIWEDINSILVASQDLWEKLRDARLFITGATGFFGRWILESIHAANQKYDLNISTLVLSLETEEFKLHAPHLAVDQRISFLESDIRNFVFPEGKFSHVIHMAATSARSTFLNLQDPLEKFETLVLGTGRVLKFTAQCGAKNFLYTSTGVVYGKQPADISHISEEFIGAPDPCDTSIYSIWGQEKRMAEFLCVNYAKKYGFDAKIARCFTFLGPFLPLDIHYAAGNFIRDAISGGPIHINGDGTQLRSYMHPIDLVIWLLTILIYGNAFRAYNVGSEATISIEQLARKVANQFNPSVKVNVAKKPTLGLTSDRYVPSTRRAHSELGLSTTIDLDDAIRRTVKYHTAV